MIHLGTPSDLLRRFVCVVAYTKEDSSVVSFEHSFTMATTEDSAYDSIELLDLENRLVAQGATLVNNYVVEV